MSELTSSRFLIALKFHAYILYQPARTLQWSRIVVVSFKKKEKLQQLNWIFSFPIVFWCKKWHTILYFIFKLIFFQNNYMRFFYQGLNWHLKICAKLLCFFSVLSLASHTWQVNVDKFKLYWFCFDVQIYVVQICLLSTFEHVVYSQPFLKDNAYCSSIALATWLSEID